MQKYLLVLFFSLSSFLANAQNVGVGTSSPTSKLHVSGNLRVDGGIRGKYREVTNTTILDTTDYFVMLTGSNTFTLTLPSPSLAGAGAAIYILSNFNNGTKTIASQSVGQLKLLNSNSLLSSFQIFGSSSASTGYLFVSDGTFWNQVSDSGNDWSKKGNSGALASESFLGTIDGEPLAIRTNNIERMRILNTGNIGIGTALPYTKLQVDGRLGINLLSNTGLQSDFIVRQTANPINATKDSILLSNLAVDIRQNSPTDFFGSGLKFTIGNTSDFTGTAAIVAERTGNWSMGKLHFAVNDSGSVTGRLSLPILMTIDGPNKAVGIGTTDPKAQLHTTGRVRLENYKNGVLNVDSIGNLMVTPNNNVPNQPIGRGTITKLKSNSYYGAQTNISFAATFSTGGTIAKDGLKEVGSSSVSVSTGGSSGTGSESGFLQVDLGSTSTTVNQHKIYFLNTSSTTSGNRFYWFKLKYSYDNITWHYAVGSENTWEKSAPDFPRLGINGKVGYVTEISVPSINARYWRLFGDGFTYKTSGGSIVNFGSTSIYEWEIFQEASHDPCNVCNEVYPFFKEWANDSSSIGAVIIRGSGNNPFDTKGLIIGSELENFPDLKTPSQPPHWSTRFIYDDAKGALRAGYSDDGRWNRDVGPPPLPSPEIITTRGDLSWAGGENTMADGKRSFAHGLKTEASGVNAVSFGEENKVSGNNSFSIGSKNSVLSNNSVALGAGNYIDRENTMAFGENNVSEANLSRLFGSFLKNKSYAECVLGIYNTDLGVSDSNFVATDPILTVGNGTSAVARSNALVILKNGNTGFGVNNPGFPLAMASGARVTSLGTWTNASDKRIKKDIEPTKYGLSEVLKMRPVDYNMIKSNEPQVGFIAQEMRKIVPEVVNGIEGDVSKVEILGISYGNLVAVLTKAIQEQQVIIDDLRLQLEKQTTGQTELLNLIQKQQASIDYLMANLMKAQR
jgi:hypothetical protein